MIVMQPIMVHMSWKGFPEGPMGMKDEPQKQADEELSEAEISARFESTVRRMANTKPVAKRPKAEGASSDAEKEIHVTRTSAKE